MLRLVMFRLDSVNLVVFSFEMSWKRSFSSGFDSLNDIPTDVGEMLELFGALAEELFWRL